MTSQRPSQRRVHPAGGARVLATGISISAMFGLTTAMAVQAAASSQAQPDVDPAALVNPPLTSPASTPAQPRVVVVKRYIYAPRPAPVIIHRSRDGGTTISTNANSNAQAAPAQRPSAARAPVAKAKPAPAPAPQAPAPVSNGTSSGSG